MDNIKNTQDYVNVIHEMTFDLLNKIENAISIKHASGIYEIKMCRLYDQLFTCTA